MRAVPYAFVKSLPPSRFPTRGDLPGLSAQDARALLNELRHYQADGLVMLRRGPAPYAPRHRRYFGQRIAWVVEIDWPSGRQRMALQDWAQAWLAEQDRRKRAMRAMSVLRHS